jgi:hypothetical protein
MSTIELQRSNLATNSIIDGLYQEAQALYDFTSNQTTNPGENQTYPTPLDVWGGSDEIESLDRSGPLLVDGLANPGTAHAAIDSLLLLEGIRRKAPNLEEELSLSARYLDNHGIPQVEALIKSDDEKLRVKALRLLIYRATDNRFDDTISFKKYLPDIIALGDRRTSPEAAQLKADVIDFLATDAVENTAFLFAFDSIMQQEDEDYGPVESSTFFEDFADSLGHSAKGLLADWEAAKGHSSLENWARKNVKVMFELENYQPGLSRKITDTFKIHNFARSQPRSLINMYQQHIEHPERPYVLIVKATKDGNGALSRPRQEFDIQETLAKHGVGLKIYEVRDINEVRDVKEKIVDEAEQYGAEIIDAVFQAHGSNMAVHLSKNQRLSKYKLECLAGIEKAFSEHAKFILHACSAGYEWGNVESFARVLSRETGTLVLAQRHSSPARLKVSVDDGKPALRPIYAPPTEKKKQKLAFVPSFFMYLAGVTPASFMAIYKNGQNASEQVG